MTVFVSPRQGSAIFSTDRKAGQGLDAQAVAKMLTAINVDLNDIRWSLPPYLDHLFWYADGVWSLRADIHTPGIHQIGASAKRVATDANGLVLWSVVARAKYPIAPEIQSWSNESMRLLQQFMVDEKHGLKPSYKNALRKAGYDLMKDGKIRRQAMPDLDGHAFGKGRAAFMFRQTDFCKPATPSREVFNARLLTVGIISFDTKIQAFKLKTPTNADAASLETLRDAMIAAHVETGLAIAPAAAKKLGIDLRNLPDATLPNNVITVPDSTLFWTIDADRWTLFDGTNEIASIDPSTRRLAVNDIANADATLNALKTIGHRLAA